MAWETRKGRGQYYTRSRRIKGRVVREYYGTGLVGSLIAQVDAERRVKREEQRRKQQRVEAMDRPLDELDAICTSLMHLALHAAGFHRHRRGEWRKRTMGKTKQLSKREKTRIDKLVVKAEGGDREALQQLQAFEGLSGRHVEALIQRIGNPARRAEKYLIHAITQNDLIAQEGLRQNADALRAELVGPTPSLLEQLLIDRIVCGWIQVNGAQAWCAAEEYKAVGGSAEKALENRLTQAQRRYLAAIKALGQVRKLLGPHIQVNIADKQINIMRGEDQEA